MAKSRKVFLLAKETPKRVTSKFDPNPAVIIAREQAEKARLEAEKGIQNKKAKADKPEAKLQAKVSSPKNTAVKASSAKNASVKVSSTKNAAVKASSAKNAAVKVDQPKTTTSFPTAMSVPVSSTPLTQAKLPQTKPVSAVPVPSPSVTEPQTTSIPESTSVPGPETTSAPEEDVFSGIPFKEVPFREDSRYLWISDKYKIEGRKGSAYRLFFKTITKVCNFQRVCTILEWKDFNPEVPKQAKQLLKKMMFRRDMIEPMMRAQEEWRSHAEVRARQIKARAEKGNEKAKKTLCNPSRVNKGEWLGNICEMISVSCGSYKPAWQRARGKQDEKRRDSAKLVKAGLVIRKFPCKEHKKEPTPMYLMIFPEQYFTKIETAIKTVYKIDETIPKKKDALEEIKILL